MRDADATRRGGCGCSGRPGERNRGATKDTRTKKEKSEPSESDSAELRWER